MLLELHVILKCILIYVPSLSFKMSFSNSPERRWKRKIGKNCKDGWWDQLNINYVEMYENYVQPLHSYCQRINFV